MACDLASALAVLPVPGEALRAASDAVGEPGLLVPSPLAGLGVVGRCRGESLPIDASGPGTVEVYQRFGQAAVWSWLVDAALTDDTLPAALAERGVARAGQAWGRRTLSMLGAPHTARIGVAHHAPEPQVLVDIDDVRPGADAGDHAARIGLAANHLGVTPRQRTWLDGVLDGLLRGPTVATTVRFRFTPRSIAPTLEVHVHDIPEALGVRLVQPRLLDPEDAETLGQLAACAGSPERVQARITVRSTEPMGLALVFG